ncbi:MAG: sigma-70 family RNA polymerase sigma factor [Candidatus Aminicenantes bacterium]|nr:sigma-70 family RNA polymerase sigma factor [Candidatus Aminicenantes bacterium]
MDEDKRIIERVLQGEKEAYAMIVEKYQKSLYNYIGRMVGERELALDFTQDIFIKSYSSLHTYSPQFKFSTWLFKIASNSVIDYWRKKKLDTFSVDQTLGPDEKQTFQIPDRDKPIPDQHELGQMRERIEKILDLIPPALRELFVWRHINEFSYEEIAEIKALPLGTIKNRVYQAKELIRGHLEKIT